jgi:hypothetical protein
MVPVETVRSAVISPDLIAETVIANAAAIATAGDEENGDNNVSRVETAVIVSGYVSVYLPLIVRGPPIAARLQPWAAQR